MPDEIKQAIESLHKAFETYKETNDQALAEIAKKGSADVLTTEKLGKIDARLDEVQKIAEEATVAANRKARSFETEKADAEAEEKAFQWYAANKRSRGEFAAKGEFGAADLLSYKATYAKMLSKGKDALGADEIKALSVGSDPDGGYLAHPDMSGRIVSTIFETSPMRQYATVVSTQNADYTGIWDGNEAGYSWFGEIETRTETTTPQIGEYTIPIHSVEARPKATQKVLDDAAINIEQWLAGKVSDVLGRGENAAFVTGDGIKKPRGFLTYPAGTSRGQIQQYATGVNGGLAAAPDGGDKLLDMVYGMKAGYRAGGVWAMSRAMQAIVRKTKDSEGNYLWAPGIAAGQPATLLGYPVADFEDMPTPATGSLSVAFANFAEAYTIVDRAGIRVVRDPYTTKGWVEFYTTKRVGGDVVNFEAIKLLKLGS